MQERRRFENFAEFYPYYLQEHRDTTCRRLHFIGTSLVIILLAFAIGSQRWWLLLLVPFAGYGFAWIGHFFYEHNRPATFSHPLYSLMGDFVMFADILRGRLAF